MVAVRQAGGPRGRGGFRLRWDGSRLRAQVSTDLQGAMQRMAADLESYLRSTLHRDTGEMAEEAFATVEVRGDRIAIRAGSNAPHTFYHEVKYHPQLRETMDVWAPRLADAIRAIARGR
jgi:hypothetical protein